MARYQSRLSGRSVHGDTGGSMPLSLRTISTGSCRGTSNVLKTGNVDSDETAVPLRRNVMAGLAVLLFLVAAVWAVIETRQRDAAYRFNDMGCVEVEWPFWNPDRIQMQEICSPSLSRLIAHPSEYDGRTVLVYGAVRWSDRRAVLAATVDAALCQACLGDTVTIVEGSGKLPRAPTGVTLYYPFTPVMGVFTVPGPYPPNRRREDVGIIVLERDLLPVESPRPARLYAPPSAENDNEGPAEESR